MVSVKFCDPHQLLPEFEKHTEGSKGHPQWMVGSMTQEIYIYLLWKSQQKEILLSK